MKGEIKENRKRKPPEGELERRNSRRLKRNPQENS